MSNGQITGKFYSTTLLFFVVPWCDSYLNHKFYADFDCKYSQELKKVVANCWFTVFFCLNRTTLDLLITTLDIRYSCPYNLI